MALAMFDVIAGIGWAGFSPSAAASIYGPPPYANNQWIFSASQFSPHMASDQMFIYAMWVIEENTSVTPSIILDGEPLDFIGTWRTDGDNLGFMSHPERPALSLHLFQRVHLAYEPINPAVEVNMGVDSSANQGAVRVYCLDVVDTENAQIDWSSVVRQIVVQTRTGDAQVGESGTIDNDFPTHFNAFFVAPSEHWRMVDQPLVVEPLVYDNYSFTLGPGEATPLVPYVIPDELWDRLFVPPTPVQFIRYQIKVDHVEITNFPSVFAVNPALYDYLYLEISRGDDPETLMSRWQLYTVWQEDYVMTDRTDELTFSLNASPISESNPVIPKEGWMRIRNSSGPPFAQDWIFEFSGLSFGWSGAYSNFIVKNTYSTNGSIQVDGPETPLASPAIHYLFGSDVTRLPHSPWEIGANITMTNHDNVPEAYSTIFTGNYTIDKDTATGPQVNVTMSAGVQDGLLQPPPYELIGMKLDWDSASGTTLHSFSYIDASSNEWTWSDGPLNLLFSSSGSHPFWMVESIFNLGVNATWRLWHWVPDRPLDTVFTNLNWQYYAPDFWFVRILEFLTEDPGEVAFSSTAYAVPHRFEPTGITSHEFDPRCKFYTVHLEGYLGLYSNIAVDLETVGPPTQLWPQRQAQFSNIWFTTIALEEPIEEFSFNVYGFFERQMGTEDSPWDGHPPVLLNPNVGFEGAAIVESTVAWGNTLGWGFMRVNFLDMVPNMHFNNPNLPASTRASEYILPVHSIHLAISIDPAPSVPRGSATSTLLMLLSEPVSEPRSVQASIIG